jgi:hypothetical protein
LEVIDAPGGGAQTTVGLRIQEKLNILAGNSNYAMGMLTNAQALAVINGRTAFQDSEQEGWNRYAGTTGLRIQDAANVKAGTAGLRVQDCVNLI